MKVLVTGASGFLGGHIAEKLSENGHHVRALVRSTSKRDHLGTLANVELFESSGVEDRERLAEAVYGVDAVVHAAGLIKAKTNDDYFTVNVGGTSNLVDAARRARPTLRRFVYVSSVVACGPSTDGTPVLADQEMPNNAYGKSKLAAEKVVLAARGDMPVVILRPGGIYGPRDGETFVLFRAIKQGLLPLVDGGRARSSWVYAGDCADACVRALDAAVPSGATYFVDDGCGAPTMKELFAEVEGALGRRALLHANVPRGLVMGVARGIEAFGKLTNRAVMLTPEKVDMMLQHWVCSSEATRQELGWEPLVPRIEGLKRSVAWYRENGWL